jgi:hypothetical protein
MQRLIFVRLFFWYFFEYVRKYLIMKKVISVLVASLIVFAACNKDNNTTPAITPSVVSNTVVSGTWKITYFWDTDHEETANYSGYNFTFGPGAVLTASKTGSTITGTWSTGMDDSQTKIILSFSSPAPFMKLSGDWHVLERTDIKIRLQDFSGGNAGTDYLTFEKN